MINWIKKLLGKQIAIYNWKVQYTEDLFENAIVYVYKSGTTEKKSTYVDGELVNTQEPVVLDSQGLEKEEYCQLMFEKLGGVGSYIDQVRKKV